MNYDGLFTFWAVILPVAAIIYYSCFDDNESKGIFSERPLNGVFDEILYGLGRLAISINGAFFLLAIGGMFIALVSYAVWFVAAMIYWTVLYSLGLPI